MKAVCVGKYVLFLFMVLCGTTLSAQSTQAVREFTISGVIYDLNGIELTPAQAGVIQNSTTVASLFNVAVSAKILGARDAEIAGPFRGTYSPKDGSYTITVRIPTNKNPLRDRVKRVDLVIESNVDAFQTVDLQRIALKTQTIDVVMPKSTHKPCGCCSPCHPWFPPRHSCAAPYHVGRTEQFQVGEQVVAARATKLMAGRHTLATVRADLQFKVKQVEGDWVGTTALVKGKNVNGWIRRSDLRHVSQIVPANIAAIEQN